MRTKIEHRWSSGRRASARFIVFLIGLLLVAAYFPALLTTAAAEDSLSIKRPDDVYIPNAAPGGGDDTSGGFGGGDTGEDDGILDGIKDFFGEMFDDIGVFLEAAFGGIGDTLNDIGSAFHDFVNWVFDLPNAISRYFEDKSRDEFNDFLQKDWTSTFSHALLGVVNDVYEIFYPFGVFVMLIAWCFGVAQAGFTMNLDPTNKYSIIRALLQLLVGMVLLTITPWLLMLIFSLCNGIRLLVASQVQAVAGHSIVLFIFQLKIYLNLAYIALLQCVSPVFMGAAAGGEGVRRFTTNFLKEYGLRCMEIVLVTLYVLMVDRIENSYSVTNNLGLISRILMPVVLSVSVFTIDKKFEKLFH